MAFTDSIRGASAYLRSAFLAVLLAPVLPDIAVDVFGDNVAPWLLRTLAVVTLLGCCVAVYVWTRHIERKFAAKNQDPSFHKVERCDVLILGWGYRSNFRPASERHGDLELPEYLVRWTQPSTVILVSTSNRENLAEIEKNLKAEGIRSVHVVSLPDPYDPEPTLPEVAHQVVNLLETHNLVGKKINVDITSGTVIMSLAMLRLALLVNAKVVYVWSQQENGKRTPFSQRSKAFDPRDVLPVPR